MSKFLIEKDDEKQWVGSLEGYDKSWTVHGEGEEFAPKEYHVFEGGKWVHQPEVAAKAERERWAADLGSVGLLQMIEELTARVAALEDPTKTNTPKEL